MTVATYKLKTPIEFGGVTYTELSIKKPKVGDLAMMDHAHGEIGKSIALYASITGVPMPAINDMDIADFQGLSEVVAPFLGESLKSPAGTTSSV